MKTERALNDQFYPPGSWLVSMDSGTVAYHVIEGFDSSLKSVVKLKLNNYRGNGAVFCPI